MAKQINNKGKTFYCVATMKIIREAKISGDSGTTAVLEIHEKNSYESEEQAAAVARDLSARYSAEFFVLKAVKYIRPVANIKEVELE